MSVFFGHALGELELFNPIGYLYVSITPFFAMSGFLLMMRDRQDDEPCSLKACWLSMTKRISRLYLLHVLCVLLVLLIWAARYLHGHTLKENIGELSLQFAAGVLMLQSWSSKTAATLNGPAWYLSAAAFLYFVFPLVKKITCMFDGRGRWKILAFLLAARILWTAFVMKIAGLELEFFKPWGAVRWGCYFFPLFRLADFWLGCLAGLFYKENKEKLSLSNAKAGALQILSAAFGICFFCIKPDGFPFWVRVFFNAEIVRIFLASLWVYFFVEGKGLLRFLNIPPLVALGNLSGLTYLIHWPLIEVQMALKSFLKLDYSKWNLCAAYGVAFAELFATIIISILWVELNKRFFQKAKAAPQGNQRP